LVTGSASINGATLDWTKLGSGSFAAGTRYTVLTATGGVIGTYLATTHSLSNFYALTASYDANDAYLDIAQVRTFAAAAETPNQAAAARGLQSLSSGSLRNSLNLLPSDAAARTAFDNLSGEAYASVNRVLISDSSIVRDAAIDRVRAAFGGINTSNMQTMAFAPASSKPVAAFASLHDGGASGLASTASWSLAPVFWSRGFGAWEKAGNNGNAAGLTSSSSGFLTGADVAAFDTWRVGLYTGYSRTAVRVTDRASAGSSDNYDLGVYGGTQWNHLGLRLGTAYSWHEVTMSRTAAFAGFSDVLAGRYDAATFQTFGELGYRTDFRRITVEPFAALAYVHFSNPGFAETGGPAALSAAAADTDTAFATLGIRGATQISLGGFTGSLHAMGGWRIAAGMSSPASTFAFAGSDPFSVAGLPIARNAAAAEAGFDVNLSSSTSFGLSYNGQFGDRVTEQNAKGNFTIRF
jgi:outer membrane autotransporter protein